MPIILATDTDRYCADDADLKHGLGRIGHLRNCESPFDLLVPSVDSYWCGSCIISNAYLCDGACVPEDVHFEAVKCAGTDLVIEENAEPDSINLDPADVHPDTYYCTEVEGADPRRSDR